MILSEITEERTEESKIGASIDSAMNQADDESPDKFLPNMKKHQTFPRLAGRTFRRNDSERSTEKSSCKNDDNSQISQSLADVSRRRFSESSYSMSSLPHESKANSVRSVQSLNECQYCNCHLSKRNVFIKEIVVEPSNSQKQKVKNNDNKETTVNKPNQLQIMQSNI